MDRFWAKVDKSGECWVWKGFIENHGYGRTSYQGNRHWLVHRLAWTLVNGPIPYGLDVCHKCDNKICVNPAHLFLGTHQDNIRDRDNKGRGKVPGFAGEQHGMAKLTEGDVLTIRGLLSEGCKGRYISQFFGIAESTISQIKNRQRWKHI